MIDNTNDSKRFFLSCCQFATLCLLVTNSALFAGPESAIESNESTGSNAVEADANPEPLDNRTATSAVRVDPLFFSNRGDHAVGSCQPLVIEVGGAEPGRMRIGVLESGIESVGDQWQAATWSAALVSFQNSGFDWRATQVIADPFSGRIDGPSAGGLMTVAILAAVRGDQIDPKVTMTGTINPDGTIGPVGGIPYKLQGAADVGKTKVLIPEFSRFEYDPFTEKNVDLIAHGKKLGIEVVPINHLRQAYKEFTGVTLPRATRPDNLPVPSSEINNVYQGRIKRWKELRQSADDKYTKMSDDLKYETTENLMQESRTALGKADSLIQVGQLPAALSELINGAFQAWAAHEIARYNYTYTRQGRDQMIQLMSDTDWLESEIDKATEQIRNFQPETVDQLAMYMLACDGYFSALCYQKLGDNVSSLVKQMPVLGDDVVIQGAAFHTVSWLNCLYVSDAIKIAKATQGGQPLPDNDIPVLLAAIYRQCAAANLAAVDAIQIPKVQSMYQVDGVSLASKELSKLVLGTFDDVYGTANVGMNDVIFTISDRIGVEPQAKLCQLSAGMSLHTRTSMLLAKYYSLGVKRDDDFRILEITNDAALAEWLHESEDQARRAIGELETRGVNPTTCTQMYSVARVREGRGGLERIDALQGYFATNLVAQVLMIISESGE